MNEHVDRLSFGFSLTTASLALQQDHLVNQSHEDRFFITGLKQAGRPATSPAVQRTAGRQVMSSMLDVIFQNSDRPKILDVYVVGGQNFNRSDSCLPAMIFTFDTPQIAKEVRYRLLNHAKATPALEAVFIEPVLTPATRVRIQILVAIKRCLAAKEIVSFVKRFDRSPSLIVLHDQRERRYSFVQACVAFRHLLTPTALQFAYVTARRDFLERLTSMFIVMTDGEQPLTTFAAPVAIPQASSSVPSTSALPAPSALPRARSNFLLQSLAPPNANTPRKRPSTSSDTIAPPKRLATTSTVI